MCCISPVLCVSKCLGSKPVSCGEGIICLFIFPLLVSLSVLILFPSSHDKHSGFLIRLGKIQNLYLTSSQEGEIYISYNIVQHEDLDRQQTTCLHNLPHHWCCISIFVSRTDSPTETTFVHDNDSKIT